MQELARTWCGTIQFLAPEVFSRQLYGRSADVWSFGITLFCMVVGRVSSNFLLTFVGALTN